MMPWKDQLRLGLRGLRWLAWPAEMKTWANIVLWITTVTILLAVFYQLWAVVLAAFVLHFPVSRLGRKNDDRPRR